MPIGDFPPPEGMVWTDAAGWVPSDDRVQGWQKHFDLAARVQRAEDKIDLLQTAMKAADYYIDRLEAVQRRRVVRDMTEAMEGYRTSRRACEQSTTGGKDAP